MTTQPHDQSQPFDYGATRPDGQHERYPVLPEEERAKGFVRPVYRAYKHVGPPGPRAPLRDLTPEEHEQYDKYGYVKYEAYPEDGGPTGRFWTQKDLDKIGKGCGVVTHMGLALCETYARDPSYYGATFCAGCGTHPPRGRAGRVRLDGWRPRDDASGGNVRQPYTKEVIAAACKRNDDLADRGIKTPDVAADFGIDLEAMTNTAFERALRAYAAATGQMDLRVGYQPTLVKPPTTEKERVLWGYLSGMWVDGFISGVMAAREAKEIT